MKQYALMLALVFGLGLAAQSISFAQEGGDQPITQEPDEKEPRDVD